MKTFEEKVNQLADEAIIKKEYVDAMHILGQKLNVFLFETLAKTSTGPDEYFIKSKALCAVFPTILILINDSLLNQVIPHEGRTREDFHKLLIENVYSCLKSLEETSKLRIKEIVKDNPWLSDIECHLHNVRPQDLED